MNKNKIKKEDMPLYDFDDKIFDSKDVEDDDGLGVSKIDEAKDDIPVSEKNSDVLENKNISIFDDEDDDSRTTPIQKYDKLRAKGTNYVFLFGPPSSGKSYVTTSLIYYMQTCGLGRIHFPESNEQQAQLLLEENYKRFHNGELIDRTSVADPPYEIDIVFEPNDKRMRSMKLTFLEMAGENLKKVRIEKGNPGSGKLPDDINIYLQCPDINIIFFLVADHMNANKDSVLIDRFLNYVYARNIRFGLSNNLLIITKWDTYPNRGQQKVVDFAKIEMRQVMSYLKRYKIRNSVTSYSVGDIKRKEIEGKKYEEIQTVDTDSASIVTQWLYETITGQSLLPEPTPWERFKQYMGI